jgi:adenylate cyclase
MVQTTTDLPNFAEADLPDRMAREDVAPNRFTEAALRRHKQEGLELAVRARWIALAITGVMLVFLNPEWDVLYYHLLLLLLAINGWFQRQVGRVGRSGAELFLMFVDLALLAIAFLLPNPLDPQDWPATMLLRYDTFQYFYIILAAGTLAYSWRTIMSIGTWTTGLWMLGGVGLWFWGRTHPELSEAAHAAFGEGSEIAELLDPNGVHWDFRVQQVVVFLIVAATLAVGVWRFNRLLLGTAALERERANLSRYFSPNVVEQLSQNDDPLKEIRSHDVAVLFVDIVGFSGFAADRPPEAVIETLRAFHGAMERQVFGHQGTLDKYLGDGLMATFGTPVAGTQDATNALACTRAMLAALDRLNAERVAAGEPPIRASFGLHFGPVVLGDIGANRLEFAVIGNTVNVASRMESATRALGVQVAMTGDLHDRVVAESGADHPALAGLVALPDQAVRGLAARVPVWALA